MNTDTMLNSDCVKRTMELYDSITGYTENDIEIIRKKYDSWAKSLKIPEGKQRIIIIEKLIGLIDKVGDMPTSEILKTLETDLGKYLLHDELSKRLDYEISAEAREILYITLNKLDKVFKE